jgi:secondary thiamine-phosphate synthase enzyme
METLSIHTRQRNEFVDITERINEVLRRQGIQQGTCVVYCPHTTAAVTINENADPDVVHDMLLWLERSIPQRQAGFRHAEGNSDSHIKSSLVGASVTLLVEKGEMVLGRWQGVYFCEFDGPRQRQAFVQVIGQ